MTKLKNFLKNNWKVFLFFLIALPFSTFGAVGITDMSSTWGGGFVVNKDSGPMTFTSHGRNITLRDTSVLSDDIFIPSATQEELDSFIASEFGQSLITGTCLPSCSAGYCGDDGCGTACRCDEGYICDGTTCQASCTPSCSLELLPEGANCSDGCGTACSAVCTGPLVCDPTGLTCVRQGHCGEGLRGEDCVSLGDLGLPCACEKGLTCFKGICN